MAIQVIYPPRCVSCGARVGVDFGLCGPCWRETPFVGDVVCDFCGVPLLADQDCDALACDDCLQMPRPWLRGRAALLYQANARRMILALKHGDRRDGLRPMHLWMARAAGSLITPDTLVAPVPLHWRRFLKRRYNQSALLGAGLARLLNLEFCPDLLIRHTATPILDGMTREERFAALSAVIKTHPRHASKIKGRPILLVDDVMTTGATFSAATRACQKSQARDVCVIALARVAKRT